LGTRGTYKLLCTEDTYKQFDTGDTYRLFGAEDTDCLGQGILINFLALRTYTKFATVMLKERFAQLIQTVLHRGYFKII
jgi:hypothetical protein